MDFSSKERALKSLLRRQLNPPLSACLREKTHNILEKNGVAVENDEIYLKYIIDYLRYSTKIWETTSIGLFLLQDYLDNDQNVSNLYTDGPRLPTLRQGVDNTEESKKTKENSKNIQNILENQLLPEVLTNLEHNEPRIRTLVAKLIGSFLRYFQESNSVQLTIYNRISISLYDHLEHGRIEDSNKAVDDTTGWRAMETSLFAMASFFDVTPFSTTSKNLSSALLPFCQEQQEIEGDKLMKSLKYSCIDHVNRHVRAAGLAALERIVHFLSFFELVIAESDSFTALLREVLKTTLSDNWSQVRMAASVLCRTLFKSIPSSSYDIFYKDLLPRMCLNRFYLAQGVKLYSHDTWKMVLQDQGMAQISVNIGAVVRYYIKMSDADNHVVREAACQAIAELATKLGTHETYKSSLEPFCHSLLQALLMCFYDESWPVRDEACLACGLFVKAYPAECQDTLEELLGLWFQNLMDPIWSVREDAALALRDALEAYEDKVLQPCIKILNERVLLSKQQPRMTQKEYATYQNDINTHTGNQLYSCGSLAPKLKKGSTKKHAGGCSDCVVDRPAAYWEITDGSLYLIRELFLSHFLSQQQQLHYFETMIEACSVSHFPQSNELRCTLWKILPVIFHDLGKKVVKREYLHICLDLLVRNCTSEYASQLSIHAAKYCIKEIADLVGSGILLGRIEMDYERDLIKDILMQESGPAEVVGDSFSPFGPLGGTIGGAVVQNLSMLG